MIVSISVDLRIARSLQYHALQYLPKVKLVWIWSYLLKLLLAASLKWCKRVILPSLQVSLQSSGSALPTTVHDALMPLASADDILSEAMNLLRDATLPSLVVDPDCLCFEGLDERCEDGSISRLSSSKPASLHHARFQFHMLVFQLRFPSSTCEGLVQESFTFQLRCKILDRSSHSNQHPQLAPHSLLSCSVGLVWGSKLTLPWALFWLLPETWHPTGYWTPVYHWHFLLELTLLVDLIWVVQIVVPTDRISNLLMMMQHAVAARWAITQCPSCYLAKWLES